ncbi:MAG: FAD-binding oxidoreductase [Candidatus Eremiobacteraeota bacterium]|nr:FAD-binding oxidoreductase [Candidatus Eremiobacteraeota bacterium]
MGSQSRRKFLLNSLRVAGLVLVAPSLTHAEQRIGYAPDRFDSLQSYVDGLVIRPGEESFAQLARPWNLRFSERQPAAIVRCATVDDISRSLAWVQEQNIPFVVRSGGHSYAAYSTTPGLLVDVSQLRSVNMDAKSGIVKLGPGSRNTTVYSHLDATSRSVTHGRCYEVGVAGLCLGGGIGFNMRLHGLTCDQLVETDIVLADGRSLTLSARENEDLFWACRGAGGGNFGVHTSFTFQTYPVDRVTAFNIDWNEREGEVLISLMNLVAGAPREMGLKVSASVHRSSSGTNEIQVSLLGQLHGPEERLRDFLKPVYDIASPSEEVIRYLPYWAGQAVLSEDGSPVRMLERSRYAQQPLPEEALTMILERLKSWPGIPGGRADWKLFLTGGAIADVAPDETAYVHRKAFGISSVELEWTGPHPLELVERNLDWVDQFHDELRPYTSDRCYQNFIDDRQQNFLTAYYGENLQRLVKIKQKYDPQNVFHYPQSLPTSL